MYTVLLLTLVFLGSASGSVHHRPQAREAKPPPLPRLVARATGRSVTARLGSYCLRLDAAAGDEQLTPAMRCADSAFNAKPTAAKIVIAPREWIMITSTRRAQIVFVGLYAVSGNTHPKMVTREFRARPISHTRKRWTLRLPKNVRGVSLIVFSVDYGQEDAEFSASATANR